MAAHFTPSSEVLLCGRLSDNVYQLFCTGCDVALDVVDSDCIDYHIRTGERPYCEACDNHTDSLPVVFGGDNFAVLLDCEVVILKYADIWRVVDTMSATCLSSSTYFPEVTN